MTLFTRSHNGSRNISRARRQVLSTTVIATLCVVLGAGVLPASGAKINDRSSAARPKSTVKAAASGPTTSSTPTSGLPVGTTDTSQPSGMAPPSANALPGYTLSYENNFTSSTLPAGWDVYSGTPGSDPGALFATTHVAVGSDLLQLNAFQDPAHGNEWVTGGLCQCGLSQTYGAYFVRSRMTGAGPTQAELLWPKAGWPPEVDFNETFGGDTSTMATVHFSSANQQDQRTLNIDMTQWHTWGVIWTPTSISYVVDGKVWGSVTVASEIPDQPMTLDIQQQTFCASNWACPTSPESLQVNWVTEYSRAIQYKVAVSPFATNSATLSASLMSQIRSLAETIKTEGYSNVTLLGYSDSLATPAKDLAASKKRAVAVAVYLKQQLAALGVSGVLVSTAGDGRATPVPAASPSQLSNTRQRVVALIY